MQYMHYALRIFLGLRTKRSQSALPATRVKREPVKHVPNTAVSGRQSGTTGRPECAS
jgi:hypothetical protein